MLRHGLRRTTQMILWHSSLNECYMCTMCLVNREQIGLGAGATTFMIRELGLRVPIY